MLSYFSVWVYAIFYVFNMSLKISRKALTITEKLSILKKYDANTTLTKKRLAKLLNIPESTLRTIIYKRKEIESNAFNGSTKRKKIKFGKYLALEKILVKWIHEANNYSVPINGPIIQEKALEISKLLNVKDFNATNGWLDRFKNRHLIVYSRINCKFKSDVDIKFWFLNLISKYTNKYASKDIFNVCEFGLFFKVMPDKSTVYKNNICSNGELSEERLTVLICANSDGTEKLKPLVIGKSLKPKCFTNIKTFPCEYIAQKQVWMTSEHFSSWVKELDLKMIEKNREILLFLDSCPAHSKKITLKNVELVFFPEYVTRKFQPMNQGVVKALKLYYRKNLFLQYLNIFQNSNIKPLNILDALYYITAAWNSIQPEIISNSFKKAGIGMSCCELIDTGESNDLKDEPFKNTLINFEEYVEVDENLIIYEPNLQNSKKEVNCVGTENNGDEDDDSTIDSLPTLSSTMNAINVVRRFISTLEKSEAAMYNINCVENDILSKQPNLL